MIDWLVCNERYVIFSTRGLNQHLLDQYQVGVQYQAQSVQYQVHIQVSLYNIKRVLAKQTGASV